MGNRNEYEAIINYLVIKCQEAIEIKRISKNESLNSKEMEIIQYMRNKRKETCAELTYEISLKLS